MSTVSSKSIVHTLADLTLECFIWASTIVLLFFSLYLTEQNETFLHVDMYVAIIIHIFQTLLLIFIVVIIISFSIRECS